MFLRWVKAMNATALVLAAGIDSAWAGETPPALADN